MNQRVNSGECGGRADVRWSVFESETGQSIAAVSLSTPLQLNFTRFVFVHWTRSEGSDERRKDEVKDAHDDAVSQVKESRMKVK